MHINDEPWQEKELRDIRAVGYFVGTWDNQLGHR